MIEYKTKTVEEKVPESITCDVCKKKYYYDKDEMEIQEFLHIRLQGGYSSVFGDGRSIKGDICQRCLNEKLGEYLTLEGGAFADFEEEYRDD
jgi:hypothetical protein